MVWCWMPIQCQAIIWTNAAILSIRPQGTFFSEISFKVQRFTFEKMHLKMPSVIWWLFCRVLNVLKYVLLNEIIYIFYMLLLMIKLHWYRQQSDAWQTPIHRLKIMMTYFAWENYVSGSLGQWKYLHEFYYFPTQICPFFHVLCQGTTDCTQRSMFTWANIQYTYCISEEAWGNKTIYSVTSLTQLQLEMNGSILLWLLTNIQYIGLISCRNFTFIVRNVFLSLYFYSEITSLYMNYFVLSCSIDVVSPFSYYILRKKYLIVHMLTHWGWHNWRQNLADVIFKSIFLYGYCCITVSKINLNMRGPSYLGLTKSISWLLMPRLLASPGHQQPWYWLCRIDRPLPYLRKDFNYPCHISLEEWDKM